MPEDRKREIVGSAASRAAGNPGLHFGEPRREPPVSGINRPCIGPPKSLAGFYTQEGMAWPQNPVSDHSAFGHGLLQHLDGSLRFTVLVRSDGKDVRFRVGLNLYSGGLIRGWGAKNGAYGAVESAATSRKALKTHS